MSKRGIADHTLTGASFRTELEIFDETKSYFIGEVVFWKNGSWETDADITGIEEGDLSNSPDNNTDWVRIEAPKYNVWSSVAQTFNNTPVILQLDTERIPDSQSRLVLNGSAVEFNFSGRVVLSLEFTSEGTTGTRSTGNAWLEYSTDSGSSYNPIPNSSTWTYNRNDTDGKSTGSITIPFDVNAGDRIIVQMQSPNGSNLTTIPDSCNLTIFTTVGGSGPRGIQGPAGPVGELNWKGDWDISGGTIYSQYETVYYLGSSYTSNTSGNTETPSDTAIKWDLVAKHGTDGSGTSILINDEGIAVPNTPHNALNFIGTDVVVSDAGSGVVDISIRETKQTYTTCIWAEENSALGSNTYEWAFGNGSNTPQNLGLAVYVPNGYTAEIVAVGLTIAAGQAEVEVEINGATINRSVVTDYTTNPSNINEVLEYTLINLDRLNFKTVTATGTSGPCVANCWIKYTEI